MSGSPVLCVCVSANEVYLLHVSVTKQQSLVLYPKLIDWYILVYVAVPGRNHYVVAFFTALLHSRHYSAELPLRVRLIFATQTYQVSMHRCYAYGPHP